MKAGITVSSKEGVSAAVEAKGAVGPVGGAVKIDKTGMHVNLESQKQHDSKIGGHVQLGVGIGLKVNLSQMGRAWSNTEKSASALAAAVVNKMVKGSWKPFPTPD